MQLGDFRAEVSLAARRRDAKPMLCQSSDEMAVAITELFRLSQASVFLLSEDLDPLVFERSAILDYARAFLARPGARLGMVSSIMPYQRGNKFAHYLGSEPNVCAYALETQWDEIIYQFVLGDDDITWFRPNRLSVSVVNFGDRSVAEHLGKILMELKSRAKLLQGAALEHVSAN